MTDHKIQIIKGFHSWMCTESLACGPDIQGKISTEMVKHLWVNRM